MKKFISILLVFVLATSMMFILTGCGEKKEEEKKATDLSAAAGTYKGLYTKFVGDSDDAKDESEPFSLELKADGTGKSMRNDATYDLTWKLDGEKFSMTETFMGITIDYTGTLKDGKLNIFNGDPEDDFTCEYVYEK